MVIPAVVRIRVLNGNHTYFIYTLLKHAGYEINVGYDVGSFGPLSGYPYITIYPYAKSADFHDKSYGEGFCIFSDAEFTQLELLENISEEAQLALLLSMGPSVPQAINRTVPGDSNVNTKEL